MKMSPFKPNNSEHTGALHLIDALSCTTSIIFYLKISPPLRTASSKQKASQSQITGPKRSCCLCGHSLIPPVALQH